MSQSPVDKPLPSLQTLPLATYTAHRATYDERETMLRRCLAIEEVRCIEVDDSQRNIARYTFAVKTKFVFCGSPAPPLLMGPGRRGSVAATDGVRHAEQHYKHRIVIKTNEELLHLSRQLFSSFDILLGCARGGPMALSKEALLSDRSGLWKAMQRGTKRYMRGSKTSSSTIASFSSTETGGSDRTVERQQRVAASPDRINERRALLDDFFTRVLANGGEIVASSRAMQDFLCVCLCSYDGTSGNAL